MTAAGPLLRATDATISSTLWRSGPRARRVAWPMSDDTTTDPANPRAPLLEAGRNCWRIAKASRCAFLIDAAAYFAALRDAAQGARRSILVLGWDIDSRTRLPRTRSDDDLPEALGDFLDALVSRRRGLHAHLLGWDFAMVYAAEREWLPTFNLGWKTHRRLHFCLDDTHPVGASHHQKLVVIDDAVAFVGGLDLTIRRWDTPAHAAACAERTDPDGTPYPPFHDVQMMVAGEVAAALGDLARERWYHACGRRLEPARSNAAASDAEAIWPSTVEPDLREVAVGIARTAPAHEGRPGAGEIRQLYLDAIGAARRTVFLESQYFTSSAVAQALQQRLTQPDGPEVALVSRRTDSGWLEEKTMGVLRARLHEQVQASDHGGRFRAYYPEQPDLDGGCINVHSKVLIVDDELVSVGSANLSNRSMGLDTECNLALEARGDERVQRAIARLRHRLLGEHLDVPPERVAAREAAGGGVLAAIESLRRDDGRTLAVLAPQVDPDIDALVPDSALIDPERPVDPERFIDERIGGADERPLPARLPALVNALVLLLMLAAAWRWTPLGEWLDLESLTAAARTLGQMPAAPLLVVGAFVLAGLLVVPLTAPVLVTLLVFGPVAGLAYALAGATASAWATYAIGRAVGRESVRRLAGTRLNRLSHWMSKRGVLTVVAVRALPIAPFSIVNLIAGASHIRLRDFIVGTVIGLAPGMVAMALFVDGLIAAIRDPGVVSLAVIALVVVLMIGGTHALRRWAVRRRTAGDAADDAPE